MSHAPPPASALERYLAFAFAGADLLVELDGADRIIFAEGAFQARFGRPAGGFAGSDVGSLVAEDQRERLAGALAVLRAKGRLSPIAVRLGDRARTPAMLAGLARPGQGAALTFGPVPDGFVIDRGADRPGDMLRAIESRLRAGGTGSLTLLELQGGSAEPEQVAATVLEALGRIAPGALADRMENGRFGVLTDQALAPGQAQQGIAGALAARGLDAGAIAVAELAVGAEGLTPAQAVRAVRFALGRFAASGQAGIAALGGGPDLPGLIAAATQRAGALRTAITQRRFSLLFQPIVALSDRRAHHHEVLVRPSTPEAESPAEFVALAEAVGLTEELDLAVATLAAEALANNPAAHVAVNISGQSLESPDFITRLLHICRARKSLRGRLLFELTETAEITRPEPVEAGLAALRDAGHPVCIDDFGAGQAGFAYIKRFATDYIKIDGHYVRGLPGNARDRAILASIVDLAGAVGSKTVAEFVETEEQAAALAEIGIEYGQGFLFGRPSKSLARG